jgi:homoserine kinase
MKARAPASSANLGPGYDVLALALRLHVQVEVVPAARLSIRAEGEGADLPHDESHLAAAVVRSVLGHDRVAITVRSSIPVGRGLGSSAALAVAAAAAAGCEEPLVVAARSDGHAENAAASVLGGLVMATTAAPGGVPIARRLPLDRRLAFVVLVPERVLLTEAARAVLPDSVALTDAVHNLGRTALLMAGLADRRALVSEAGDDRLHQPARTPLFPEAPALLDALRRGGATVSCWSGAGPSLLAICDDAHAASQVASAGEKALIDLGVGGHCSVVEPDLDGVVLSP